MEIYFSFAGMEFEVGLDVGRNLEFYGVAYVSMLTKEKAKFEPILVDTEQFYKDLKDIIDGEYEKAIENLKQIEGDLMFDRQRDAKL